MKEEDTRTVLPVRYITCEDMEKTGEFDPDFIQQLKAKMLELELDKG